MFIGKVRRWTAVQVCIYILQIADVVRQVAFFAIFVVFRDSLHNSLPWNSPVKRVKCSAILCSLPKQLKFVPRPRLFKRRIALSTGVSIILIRWIVIYPVDSAIQRFNNRGQVFLIYSSIICQFLLHDWRHQFNITNLVDNSWLWWLYLCMAFWLIRNSEIFWMNNK